LARDIGQELGVGAYLSSLCRTRIGSFKLEDAKTIEQIASENNYTLHHKREDAENHS
jgi:tRNA pseudouridine55 synthase